MNRVHSFYEVIRNEKCYYRNCRRFRLRKVDLYEQDQTVFWGRCYHDNYYRRQDGIPFEERVKVNYDHPDSLETDLLVEHLKELKDGRAIECPVYDYSQHNRSNEIIKIEPRPIILVEGILLLADERIRDLLDIKVYVEADADERILRRIVRDVEERGRDLRGIISQYLTTVKPMHYMYVEPTRALADIVINSGKNDVAFDLFVSKIGQLLESTGY